jgi:uncharacterized protein (TIGR00251 family)
MGAIWYDVGMKIRILVKSNKHEARVAEGEEGLIIELKSKPVDGAANIELMQVLAEHFQVPKTHIKILRGVTSRHKTIEIIF